MTIHDWLVTGCFHLPEGIPSFKNILRMKKEHTRLFKNLLSPHESNYTEHIPSDKVKLVATLANLYRAFSVDVSEEDRSADSLEAELEFMAWLVAKEELALKKGDYHHAAQSHEAQGKFLQEHLGRWVPAFLMDLKASSPDPFYLKVMALSETFLTMDMEREFSLKWKDVSKGVLPRISPVSDSGIKPQVRKKTIA